MNKNNKLKLNIKFKNNKVICAKSPEFCVNCKNRNDCETLKVFYDPYPYKDIINCFNNSERRR